MLPRGERPNNLREKIYEINCGVEQLVPSIPNTYFLNADPGFVRADQKIASEDMLDYLHLTRRGYSRFCVPVCGLVKRLLA